MVSSRSSSTTIDDKNEENKRKEEELKGQEEEEVINGTTNNSNNNNNNVNSTSSSLSTVEVLDFVGEPTDNAILSGRKRNVRSVAKGEGGVEIKGEGGRRTSAGAAVDKDDAEWGRRSNDGPLSSLSMSLDLQNHPVGSASPQNDSGDYSNIDAGGGTAIATDTCGPLTTTTETNNNALSSITNIKLIGNNREEEESYEGFGFGSDFGSSSGFGSVEVDADGEPEDGQDDADSPGGSSSAPSPTGSNPFSRNPRSPNSTIGRHSWLRTSLRRTPPCSGRKRISSNALASQLYRSGSFNSSGRGSNCDNTDDMYSDVSLEEDFIDLNHRTVRRKKDAIQNCPAEFVRCVGMVSGLKKECSMPCEQCKKLPVNTMSSTKIYKTMQNKSDEIDEDEKILNTGIINIPRSKISIATDMSSLNALNTDRS